METSSDSRRSRSSSCRPCTTRLFWIFSAVFVCGLLLSRWIQTPRRMELIKEDGGFSYSSQSFILLWTKVWSEDAHQIGAGNIQCDGSRIKCEFTSDRSAANGASALVFHARDVRLRDVPLRVSFTSVKDFKTKIGNACHKSSTILVQRMRARSPGETYSSKF